jgi:hypothetical protein
MQLGMRSGPTVSFTRAGADAMFAIWPAGMAEAVITPPVGPTPIAPDGPVG